MYICRISSDPSSLITSITCRSPGADLCEIALRLAWNMAAVRRHAAVTMREKGQSKPQPECGRADSNPAGAACDAVSAADDFPNVAALPAGLLPAVVAGAAQYHVTLPPHGPLPSNAKGHGISAAKASAQHTSAPRLQPSTCTGACSSQHSGHATAASQCLPGGRKRLRPPSSGSSARTNTKYEARYEGHCTSRLRGVRSPSVVSQVAATSR